MNRIFVIAMLLLSFLAAPSAFADMGRVSTPAATTVEKPKPPADDIKVTAKKSDSNRS